MKTDKKPYLLQINISDGGVPKLPVQMAPTSITTEGVIGDRHRKPGGLDRAVCLYSLDLIKKLKDEGHPVFPGSTGENLTIAGLDWTKIKIGDRVRVGETVCLEITSYTTPCKVIASSFIDGKVNRIFQKNNPGWSRLYAKVISEGVVKPGDSISLEPKPLKGWSTINLI